MPAGNALGVGPNSPSWQGDVSASAVRRSHATSGRSGAKAQLLRGVGSCAVIKVFQDLLQEVRGARASNQK